MATTVTPEVEAEFQRLWSHTPTPSPEIGAWLRTFGVKQTPSNFAQPRGFLRYGAVHQIATADRLAIQILNTPEPVREEVVRKPTPEERAARRVPVGGYRMGSVRL